MNLNQKHSLMMSILIFQEHQYLSFMFVDKSPSTKITHQKPQSYMNLNLDSGEVSNNKLNSMGEEFELNTGLYSVGINPIESPHMNEISFPWKEVIVHKESLFKDILKQKPNGKFFGGLYNSNQLEFKPKNELNDILDQSSSSKKKLSASAKPFQPRKLVTFEPGSDMTETTNKVPQDYTNVASGEFSKVFESNPKPNQSKSIEKEKLGNEWPYVSHIVPSKIKSTQQHSKFVLHSPLSSTQDLSMIEPSKFEWEYEKLLEYEKMVSKLIGDKDSNSIKN